MVILKHGILNFSNVGSGCNDSFKIKKKTIYLLGFIKHNEILCYLTFQKEISFLMELHCCILF